MSYESFGGGSHGTHEWVAIGHEQRDLAPWEPGHATASGSWAVPFHKADIRYYVVRACQLCPEVWWQEYDLKDAIETQTDARTSSDKAR